MDLTTRLAARLTHELVTLRGTQNSLTLNLGRLFLQAASYQARPCSSRSPPTSTFPWRVAHDRC